VAERKKAVGRGPLSLPPSVYMVNFKLGETQGETWKKRSQHKFGKEPKVLDIPYRSNPFFMKLTKRGKKVDPATFSAYDWRGRTKPGGVGHPGKRFCGGFFFGKIL